MKEVMNSVTGGTLSIGIFGLLLWLQFLSASRHFMKQARMCTENTDSLSPDVHESQRRDMAAFHRSATWASLGGFVTIFATTAAIQLCLAASRRP